MSNFVILLSLNIVMQVLGIDAWDLLDSHTEEGLVEALLWVWYLWSRRDSSSTPEVVYYLEVE